MIQGHDHFGPKGLDWKDLCRGPLDILNMLAVGLLVSAKKVFFYVYPIITGLEIS